MNQSLTHSLSLPKCSHFIITLFLKYFVRVCVLSHYVSLGLLIVINGIYGNLIYSKNIPYANRFFIYI